jgi:sugar lactone lactonase YvrE
VYVAAYRSASLNVQRGPCRVFRLDPASGAETGHVDVPAPCGHAGGVAFAADGRLYLTDTHDLFAIDLAGAFAGTEPQIRHWPLGPGLRGALAASDRGAIWIGTYEEKLPGRLFRFDTARLGGVPPGAPLLAEQASAALAIPSYAQGAAFDGAGKLWVSRSDTLWGELIRLDARTGVTEATYAFAPGVEGIAFDAAGRLWAVSEAGAKHAYIPALALLGMPFYPLVFSVDPARLE